MEKIKVYGNYEPVRNAVVNFNIPPDKLAQFTNNNASDAEIYKNVWSIVLNGQNLIVCTDKQDVYGMYFLPALGFVERLKQQKNESQGKASVLILSGRKESIHNEVYQKLESLNRIQTYMKNCSISSIASKTDIVYLRISELTSATKAFKVLFHVQLIIIDGLEEILANGEYRKINSFLHLFQRPLQFLILSASFDIQVRLFVEVHFVTKLNDYVKLVIGNADQIETAIQRAKHHVHVCKKFDKMNKLCKILAEITKKSQVDQKALILVNPEDDGIDDIYSYLLDAGYPVLKTNEDNQNENDNVWSKFLMSGTNILVTTDSFSKLRKRTSIEHVVIYDFPSNEMTVEADYVFQISLAGNTKLPFTGQSHLLYTDKDLPRAQELIDIKNELKQPIELELRDIAGKQFEKQIVPRRRLTLFEILPEAIQSIESPSIGDNSENVDTQLKIENQQNNTNTKHYVELVMEQDKFNVLESFFENYMSTNKTGKAKVVIFANNEKINKLSTRLAHASLMKFGKMSVVAIPTSASVTLRNHILEGFRQTQNKILITSDNTFVNQKLDLDTNVIINYDFPETAKIYKGRIDNIAETMKNGLVITFFAAENFHCAEEFVTILRELNQTINPLLLQPPLKSTIPSQTIDDKGGNLTELYENWCIETKMTSSQASAIPESTLNLVLSKFKQISQYVEIIVGDKDKVFLKLLTFLSDRSRFPNIKAVIFTSSLKIIELQQLLEQSLDQTILKNLPVHNWKQDCSNQERLKLLNAHKQGLFFTPLSLLEEQRIYDVKGVNVVIHFNFPKYADSYLKSLRLIKGNGFVFTFFVPQNYQSLKPFVEVLQTMDQPINPLLLKIVDKTNVKKIQNVIESEKTGNIGCIDAFINYIKSAAYSQITESLRAIHEIDVSNIHQFVEIVAEDNTKFNKLQSVLNALNNHQQLQKFKMIIFAKSTFLESLSKQITDNYSFPVSQVPLGFGSQILTQIVKSFRNGVLLISSDSNNKITKDISNVNFIVNYDFVKEDYVYRISNLHFHTDSFVISFLTAENKTDVDFLIHILRETQQEINPQLFTMQRNQTNIFSVSTETEELDGNKLKIGNVKAFVQYLTHSPHIKCPSEVPISVPSTERRTINLIPKPIVEPIVDEPIFEPEVIIVDDDDDNDKPLAIISQFVEILHDEEKPTKLLTVICKLFADNAKYSKSKVLVFATLSHIDMLHGFLNEKGRQMSETFPQILTIPEAAGAGVRKQLLSLFASGILLISPYNFLDTQHYTGIQGIRCVINYDFPKPRTATKRKSVESVEMLIDIYLKRISNVNVISNGCALTFFSPYDINSAESLIQTLVKNEQKVNPILIYMGSLFAANKRRNIGSSNDSTTITKIKEHNKNIGGQLTVGNVTAMYAYLNVLVQNSEAGSSTDSISVKLRLSNSPSQQHYEENLFSKSEPLLRNGRQYVEILHENDKAPTLLKLMQHLFLKQRKRDMKILIFANELKIYNVAEFLHRFFNYSRESEKYPTVLAITANDNPAACQEILISFQMKSNQLLIVPDDFFKNQCSSIAGINLVINYDLPVFSCLPQIYRNRISNADVNGNIITFFSQMNLDCVDPFVYILSDMNQEVNFLLQSIQMRHSNQEKSVAMHNALSARQSISLGNIVDYLESLDNNMPSFVAAVEKKPPAKSNTTHLHYVEVLSATEKSQSLHELIQHIFKLTVYKNIKIVLFVRDLTISKIKAFDELLHTDMVRVMSRFPNFNRFYAYRNCDPFVISRNARQYLESTNAILITDVDPKELNFYASDFLIFYDTASCIENYSEAANTFDSTNAAFTFFITLLAPTDRMAHDYMRILERSNQPINPLILKLIENENQPIADDFLKILRRTVAVGNLSALYLFTLSDNFTKTQNLQLTTALVDTRALQILESQLPNYILNWLERYVNKDLQTSIIPSIFSNNDLLATSKNTDEMFMAFLISAVGITMLERPQRPQPLLIVFTATDESLRRGEAMIRMFNGVLQTNGINVDLNTYIVLGSLKQFCELNSNERIRFRYCKYVMFDNFDKTITLDPIGSIYTILESIIDGTLFANKVGLKVFSSEFSVYEKLVSLDYMRKDHHLYNATESEALTNSFSNVQQFFELKILGKERKSSMVELLQQISNVDISSCYSIIIFFNDDVAALNVAYQNLIIDYPKVAGQVFHKKIFQNSYESDLFWSNVHDQPHPIFLTNDVCDAHQLQNVKYVINFDYPTGRSSSFEYLQRMRHIKTRTGFVVSYFGLKDFVYSNVLVKMLEHMNQPINPLLRSMQGKNLSHSTFAQEVKAMSSNSIGDLTDFFMALCLMDTDDNEQIETKRKTGENSNYNEDKRSRWSDKI